MGCRISRPILGNQAPHIRGIVARNTDCRVRSIDTRASAFFHLLRHVVSPQPWKDTTLGVRTGLRLITCVNAACDLGQMVSQRCATAPVSFLTNRPGAGSRSEAPARYRRPRLGERQNPLSRLIVDRVPRGRMGCIRAESRANRRALAPRWPIHPPARK